jgi:hypothetical protein
MENIIKLTKDNIPKEEVLGIDNNGNCYVGHISIINNEFILNTHLEDNYGGNHEFPVAYYQELPCEEIFNGKGYLVPMNLFEGRVKKGTVYFKNKVMPRSYYSPKQGMFDAQYALPKEIVETWEKTKK